VLDGESMATFVYVSVFMPRPAAAKTLSFYS